MLQGGMILMVIKTTKILTPLDNKKGALIRLKATKILSKKSKSIKFKNIRLAKVGKGFVVIGERK